MKNPRTLICLLITIVSLLFATSASAQNGEWQEEFVTKLIPGQDNIKTCKDAAKAKGMECSTVSTFAPRARPGTLECLCRKGYWLEKAARPIAKKAAEGVLNGIFTSAVPSALGLDKIIADLGSLKDKMPEEIRKSTQPVAVAVKIEIAPLEAETEEETVTLEIESILNYLE